ncbi:hypothetical protein D7X87_07765 [bacterium D16-54]|nr:hypothetical protein D7X87_07765 [bacterium D16-54]RKJ15321.1 hypothetical protein D7X65_07880 [bacterium D16-56]
MTSNNKAFKAGFWYVISNFLVKGLAFITTPIFTRLMTKNEIGIFSVGATWVSILTVLSTLNLYDTVMLAKYDFEAEFEKYISTIVILGTLISMAVYAGVFIVPNIEKIIDIPDYAIHIIFIYVAFSPCTQILLTKYRSEMKYKESAILSVIISIVPSVLAVGLAICLEDKLKGRFFGFYLPLILLNVALFLYLIVRGKSFKWRYCRYAFPIAIPMVVHYLNGTIMGFSDRLMIQKMCNTEEVALYSIAYTCAAMMDVLRNSLNAAWDPWVFEKLSLRKHEEIKKYSKPYVIFYLIICLYVIFLAPDIMILLGGDAYIKAVYVIPPVIVGYIFCMIYSLYACVERFCKKQKWFAFISSVAACTNIVLNLWFIPKFGYIAAAYTTLIGYAVSCGLHFINSYRFKITYMYDTKFNVFVLFSGLAMILLSNLLYLNFLFRYAVIICITIILLVIYKREKDNIKNFIADIQSN